VPQPVYCGAFSHWLLALHCLHVPHSLHWRVTLHSSTNEPQTIPLEAQVWFEVQTQEPPAGLLQENGGVHDPQISGTPQSLMNVPQVWPAVAQLVVGVHPPGG
jgi:hypothetical protein